MVRLSKLSDYLTAKQLAKELEVPSDRYDNNCMMNEMKYKQLLNLQWLVDRKVSDAKKQFEEYKKYKNDSVLYDIALRDLREARDAQKTVEQVINVMRGNELYVYGD